MHSFCHNINTLSVISRISFYHVFAHITFVSFGYIILNIKLIHPNITSQCWNLYWNTSYVSKDVRRESCCWYVFVAAKGSRSMHLKILEMEMTVGEKRDWNLFKNGVSRFQDNNYTVVNYKWTIEELFENYSRMWCKIFTQAALHVLLVGIVATKSWCYVGIV